MAAPFGPPPSCATTRTLPSGVTRESVRRSISTRITEPSGMATGPSGKRRPEAICVNLGLMAAMVSLLWLRMGQQAPHSATNVTSTGPRDAPTDPGEEFPRQKDRISRKPLNHRDCLMALPLHVWKHMASKVFHRIVVPTDFSDYAEKAWALAQGLASALDSEVVLAHVFVEPPLYGEPPLTPDATWQVFEKARKWVEEELEKWAAGARKKGATVRPIIRTGAPAEQIVELATTDRKS